jgi:hypothetical protein
MRPRCVRQTSLVELEVGGMWNAAVLFFFLGWTVSYPVLEVVQAVNCSLFV